MSRHRESGLSRDSSVSTSTIDAIREICNGCCDNQTITRVSRPVRAEYPYHTDSPQSVYDSGVSSFTSVITPIAGLTPLYSGCVGSVEFRMRRKNKTVTLQWEPFTGSLAASGITFLTVVQSISNTPPYPISIPNYIEYKGIGRMTNIIIDPHSISGNIFFNINTDGSTNGTNTGDFFKIPGGTITWIVD